MSLRFIKLYVFNMKMLDRKQTSSVYYSSFWVNRRDQVISCHPTPLCKFHIISRSFNDVDPPMLTNEEMKTCHLSVELRDLVKKSYCNDYWEQYCDIINEWYIKSACLAIKTNT